MIFLFDKFIGGEMPKIFQQKHLQLFCYFFLNCRRAKISKNSLKMGFWVKTPTQAVKALVNLSEEENHS